MTIAYQSFGKYLQSDGKLHKSAPREVVEEYERFISGADDVDVVNQTIVLDIEQAKKEMGNANGK